MTQLTGSGRGALWAQPEEDDARGLPFWQALLIAALSAEGTSVIHNIEQIDRGYQHIDTRLTQLGADIRRI